MESVFEYLWKEEYKNNNRKRGCENWCENVTN